MKKIAGILIIAVSMASCNNNSEKKTDEVKERMDEIGKDIKEKMNDVTEKTEARMEELRDSVQSKIEKFKKKND